MRAFSRLGRGRLMVLLGALLGSVGEGRQFAAANAYHRGRITYEGAFFENVPGVFSSQDLGRTIVGGGALFVASRDDVICDRAG